MAEKNEAIKREMFRDGLKLGDFLGLPTTEVFTCCHSCGLVTNKKEIFEGIVEASEDLQSLKCIDCLADLYCFKQYEDQPNTLYAIFGDTGEQRDYQDKKKERTRTSSRSEDQKLILRDRIIIERNRLLKCHKPSADLLTTLLERGRVALGESATSLLTEDWLRDMGLKPEPNIYDTPFYLIFKI